MKDKVLEVRFGQPVPKKPAGPVGHAMGNGAESMLFAVVEPRSPQPIEPLWKWAVLPVCRRVRSPGKWS